MKFTGRNEERLQVVEVDEANCNVIKENLNNALTILWFEEESNELIIDLVKYSFSKNEIVFLTDFNTIDIVNISKARFIRFNKEFYCIVNHDSEVGCKGILFYSASSVPILKIPNQEIERIDLLWKTFLIEMKSKDDLQIEMLQILLKRLLILCTRFYKEANDHLTMDTNNLGVFRQFNYLVQQHFKEKHTVAEYANLLNKSPKTLSNIFSQSIQKTPLQIIQARRLSEAKNLLAYSELAVSEIAYELGYEDIHTFSKFFKRKTKKTPSNYRDQINRKN